MGMRERAVGGPQMRKRRAARKGSTAIHLQEEIANLRLELLEVRQRQVATADVLKVISRSVFDLQTLLQALVESVARLCDADKAVITRQIDGGFFRAQAHGFSDEFMSYARTVPVVPGRGSAIGRALIEGIAVHIPDVEADVDYAFIEIRLVRSDVVPLPMLSYSNSSESVPHAAALKLEMVLG